MLFEKEKYEEAFRFLLPCAEQGIAEAQAQVGVMYQLGMGVMRDIKVAVRWLTLAAENGRGDAAHNLGTLYLTCAPDVRVSKKKSTDWYRKAKNLGFEVASTDWYGGKGKRGRSNRV